MVTTRRGTETPGQEATPRSSGKKKAGKRELDVLDTPTAVKRRKKSVPKQAEEGAVREPLEPEPAAADEEAAPESAEDTSDTITVTVPQEATPKKKAGKLPIRRRSSPKVVVAKPSPPESAESEPDEDTPQDNAIVSEHDAVFQTPHEQPCSVYATPATRKPDAGSPTPRQKRASERTSAKESSGRKERMRTDVDGAAEELDLDQSSYPDEIPSSTFESEQAPIMSQDAPISSPPPEQGHVRFGSEDPEETQGAIKMNLQGHKRYGAPDATQEEPDKGLQQDEDEDASDSDEAPEMVTTSAAASNAKAKQEEAARARLAQQSKEEMKRAVRELNIAEQKAAKRKREEWKAKKMAKKLAKQEAVVDEPSIEPELSESIDRRKLPALLPTSLLSNLSDQRAPTPPPILQGMTEEEIRKEKLNHHIKFLERSEKGPKDLKKGKLSVTVLGQQNRALPPKANRSTKSVREKWLKGRSVEGKKKSGKISTGGKMERRPFGNRGFLRDD